MTASSIWKFTSKIELDGIFKAGDSPRVTKCEAFCDMSVAKKAKALLRRHERCKEDMSVAKILIITYGGKNERKA